MNVTHILIGSLLTITIYSAMSVVDRKFKIPMFNTMVATTTIIIGFILFLDIDYEIYAESAKPLSSLMGPLITLLALPLYKTKYLLAKHSKSILLGIFSCAIITVLSVVLMSWIFGFEHNLMVTLLTKSITTPMALSMTEMLGGISGITVASVVLTGIIGVLIINSVITIFKIDDPIAIGVALGATTHGLGTSKAIELGEEIGAVSGLSMGLTGIIYILVTSLITAFI